MSPDDEICGLDFKYHQGYVALDFNRRVELAKQKMEREKVRCVVLCFVVSLCTLGR